MLRATRRGLGSWSWLVAGLVALVPSLAEAQLFPNRTIRRERPACTTESPFNAQVRRDYFGYYPTCWTRFPEGWGCPAPNPELPNLAASLASQPFDTARKPPGADPFDDPMGDDSGLGPMDDRRGTNPPDPNLPPAPAGSPFRDPRSNPPGNTQPGADPSFPGSTAPSRPGPGTGPGTTGVPPTPPPTSRVAPRNNLMEMPDLPEVAPAVGTGSASNSAANLGAGSMSLVPEATLVSNPNPDFDRPNLGPLPSAPLPAPSTPGPVMIPDPSESDQILGRPAPARAPKRRSLIGSLFNRGDSRNR